MLSFVCNLSLSFSPFFLFGPLKFFFLQFLGCCPIHEVCLPPHCKPAGINPSQTETHTLSYTALTFSSKINEQQLMLVVFTSSKSPPHLDASFALLGRQPGESIAPEAAAESGLCCSGREQRLRLIWQWIIWERENEYMQNFHIRVGIADWVQKCPCNVQKEQVKYEHKSELCIFREHNKILHLSD